MGPGTGLRFFPGHQEVFVKNLVLIIFKFSTAQRGQQCRNH